MQIHRCLPEFLRLQAEDEPGQSVDPQLLFAKILIQLEHLQNLFFIRRLLVKARHNPSDNLQLVETSHEMLQVAEFMRARSVQLSKLNYSFGWLVVGYVCPAVGLLCSELLVLSSPIHASQSYPHKPDVIDKLGSLEEFLSSIEAEPSTMALCLRIKSLVRRTLEKCASTSLPRRRSESSETDVGSDIFGVIDHWDMSFSFDLLNPFDF